MVKALPKFTFRVFTGVHRRFRNWELHRGLIGLGQHRGKLKGVKLGRFLSIFCVWFLPGK